MKNLITFSLCIISIGAFAQMQINKPLQLTGSGVDAKIEGIQDVSNDNDAASKKYVDTTIANNLTGPQSLSTSGDTIFISGGNYVIIPGIQYANNLITVQNRLNAGETPLQIYNSDNSLLSELYGKEYEGGYIFYFNTSTGEGLISAPQDQSSSDNFGCYNSNITGADGTAVGTGAQNTQDLVNNCGEAGIAAKICDALSLNTYSDWFLPSRDEMVEMNTYKSLIEGPLGLDGYHVSSSEKSYSHSWLFDFSGSGNTVDGTKDNNYKVRCVRAF